MNQKFLNVFLLNNYFKSQSDLAEAANITEVTIRNRCKGLKEMLKN